MNLDQIPLGSPEQFNVLIEIPTGSENKYEYDPALQAIKLDYVFHDGFKFPFNYGSIPQTRGGDGDHLDAVVLSSNPIAVGVIVLVKPVGMLRLKDNGEQDNKVISVPLVDPVYSKINDVSDLSDMERRGIADFFKEVGVQKQKKMEIEGFADRNQAIKEIEESKI